MANFSNALGNIGLMYQGANAQEQADIQLQKLKDDQEVTSALGRFDPGMLANMLGTGGAGNDIMGTQPIPQAPPQGGPMPPPGPPMPPPPPPSLGGGPMSVGAPGAAGPQSMPMPGGGVQMGPMSQPGPQQPPPPPPQAPPQGMPPGGPQGAPSQGAPPNMAGGAPSAPMDPQKAALLKDPFVQQAMSIVQSLPPAQRGLFYKNFYMPMLQQRAEAQRSAQQFEETRADRRQTAEWRHEDATTAAAAKHEDRIRDLELKDRAERDRYEVAMQRAEDTASRNAETARHNQVMEGLQAEARRLTAEVQKGNLQARRDTLELQKEKFQVAAAKGDAAAKAKLAELDDVQRQLTEMQALEGSSGNLGLGVTGAAGDLERVYTPIKSLVNSLTGKPPPDTSAAELKSRVKAAVPQITKILSGSNSSNGGAWTQKRVEEALGALAWGTTSKIAQDDAAALKRDLESHRPARAVGEKPANGGGSGKPTDPFGLR